MRENVRMPRMSSRLLLITFIASYGIVGALGLLIVIDGHPLGWVAVALSVLGLVLRGFRMWGIPRLVQRSTEAAQRKAARDDLAPTAVEEPSEQLIEKRRRAIAIVYIGPLVIFAIASIVADLLLPSALKIIATVLAVTMSVTAVFLGIVFRRASRRAISSDPPIL